MRDDSHLWQGHELCRFLFEGSHDAVVVTSEDGRIQAMNRAARALQGVDVQRLLEGLGSSNLDLAAFRASLRANGRATADVRLDSDGESGTGKETRHLVLEGTALRENDVIVLRDVTEHKSLERELWHLRRVESVGHLTASVVHDFNNLLTPIVCLSALLTNELEDGSAASMARDIRSASERAAGLVRQMLSLVRRAPSPLERVSLNNVVSEMGGLIERMMGEDVHLVVELDRNLGDAKVDREQLEHVLLNLAANARDAMPRGGTLAVRTANVTLGEDDDQAGGPKSGAYVVLAVSDNGTGMVPEVRERIFERFFTTKDIGKGTGLGLATAHRFVAQSGGCIAVRSEPGQGTTVSIYLPRASAVIEASPASKSSHGLPRGTETILVVEDDDQVRRVVRTVLEEQGYRIVEASSGPIALEKASQRGLAIDLVLVDLVMPEMSGHALIEKLRPTLGTAKVLFMSGHTDKTIGEYGLDSREDAILRKAFSPADLANRVREVLDENADRASA